MRAQARLLFLAAGACDTATGIALLAAPAATLALMGIEDGPRDPALVRFIGAFVLGVGASYLLALARASQPGFVRTVAEITALVRACVGGYVAIALYREALPFAWVAVAATDVTLATLQLTLLGKGWFDD